MPPKTRRRALSVSPSRDADDDASVVGEAPNTRRSKRRKLEPAEVLVKSEPKEPKLKSKTSKKQPKGKKIKEEVKQEPDVLEDVEPGTTQSADSPHETVHIDRDIEMELEILRRQLREKDEVSSVFGGGIIQRSLHLAQRTAT
jgi:hypothetical protein